MNGLVPLLAAGVGAHCGSEELGSLSQRGDGPTVVPVHVNTRPFDEAMRTIEDDKTYGRVATREMRRVDDEKNWVDWNVWALNALSNTAYVFCLGGEEVPFHFRLELATWNAGDRAKEQYAGIKDSDRVVLIVDRTILEEGKEDSGIEEWKTFVTNESDVLIGSMPKRAWDSLTQQHKNQVSSTLTGRILPDVNAKIQKLLTEAERLNNEAAAKEAAAGDGSSTAAGDTCTAQHFDTHFSLYSWTDCSFTDCALRGESPGCAVEDEDVGESCCGDGICGAGGVCEASYGFCEDEYTCDDGNDCTVDTCDEEYDYCIATPAPDGTSCDGGYGGCMDGYCEYVYEFCADGYSCDDGNDCTVDTCDEQNDACGNAPAPNGTSCDGGYGACDDGYCNSMYY